MSRDKAPSNPESCFPLRAGAGQEPPADQLGAAILQPTPACPSSQTCLEGGVCVRCQKVCVAHDSRPGKLCATRCAVIGSRPVVGIEIDRSYACRRQVICFTTRNCSCCLGFFFLSFHREPRPEVCPAGSGSDSILALSYLHTVPPHAVTFPLPYLPTQPHVALPCVSLHLQS